MPPRRHSSPSPTRTASPTRQRSPGRQASPGRRVTRTVSDLIMSATGMFSRSTSRHKSPSSGRSEHNLSRQLSSLIDPVQKSSRAQDIHEVRAQRSASLRASEGTSARRGSRVALQPMQQLPERGSPTRMSRVGSTMRNQIVQSLGDASKLAPVGDLSKRLDALGMQMQEMEGDGNCQFRAVAFNLFESQSHHTVVRQTACAHMQKNSDFFGIFFDGESEFNKYLCDMRRNRTWGDELTLRAIVEAYCCEAHVITSESANWYLVYSPETTEIDEATVACPKGWNPPRFGKQIFLSYISPIHYNAIVARA
ncbi:hypothetical protein AB1Y20_013145 [Prymnesium parvum]|uniref:OTU domain-containing protein n=1 Tax=Prymnesium parvum TaxID=97485 RepID=A0AB34INE3_PRYPA